MDDVDLRVRNHLYAAFVREGEAWASGETAIALQLTEPAVAAAYERLHEAHALVLEQDRRSIRMLNPFSVVPSEHVVDAGGRSWFANCAWDALGIPAALGTDGTVRSTCADCGEVLELEVRVGRLVRGGDLLVHFLVPARHWWDDIVFT
jgi:hypothetical protein